MTTWIEIARWAQKRSFELSRLHPELSQSEVQRMAYAEAPEHFPGYHPISRSGKRKHTKTLQPETRRTVAEQPQLTADDAIKAVESLLVEVNKREGYHNLVELVVAKKIPFVPNDDFLLSIMQAFGVYPGKSKDKNFYNERKRMEREEHYGFIERADGLGFDVLDPREKRQQEIALEIAKLQAELAALGRK